ncbi:hypothetical protein F7725_014905 [Dissostichus mawsoni]|uniref:Phospholipid/glycerol acyltransferase domain-containing protein n=1 Tax=Dissostichus mawsoni TaxID=36200 RepID=A0A7J5YJE9_DISMA|nr:hypothetical protein F7725_014905 [Dissostichus mawsoni]
MEGVAVWFFQLWMFVVLFLIMLPAMFGLSLGVTGVYIQGLWATLRIQREREQQSGVPDPLPNGGGRAPAGRRPPDGGLFSLSDALLSTKRDWTGDIVDDTVTQRFSSEELNSWNLLTRTNQNFRYISLRLTLFWGVGVFIRYGLLLPFSQVTNNQNFRYISLRLTLFWGVGVFVRYGLLLPFRYISLRLTLFWGVGVFVRYGLLLPFSQVTNNQNFRYISLHLTLFWGVGLFVRYGLLLPFRSLTIFNESLKSQVKNNQNFRYISLRLTLFWGVGVFVRYGLLLPFRYISLRLTLFWGVGVFVRYGLLLPFRVTLVVIGLLARHRNRSGGAAAGEQNWLSELVHLTCYRVCARGLSATILYHNKSSSLVSLRENRPQKGGICVANHTTPIDIVILANDGCYAMVGQVHGGLMGVLQRSMSRSCPHVWFERSEMKDRHTVTNRLRAHVAARTKLPILIFPEGQSDGDDEDDEDDVMYDARFGDAFWNSSKYNMVSYLLRMMTSWAIVVNVWYLPPMEREEEEDAAQLLTEDGGLKRGKVKDSFREEQQKQYSSIITATDQ